jgi:hypothetical protein
MSHGQTQTHKTHHSYYNPSLGLTTKTKGCKVASQEKDPVVTSHAPESAKEFERTNPHTPKRTPMLGVGIAKVKTHLLEEFFISLENY